MSRTINFLETAGRAGAAILSAHGSYNLVNPIGMSEFNQPGIQEQAEYITEYITYVPVVGDQIRIVTQRVEKDGSVTTVEDTCWVGKSPSGWEACLGYVTNDNSGGGTNYESARTLKTEFQLGQLPDGSQVFAYVIPAGKSREQNKQLIDCEQNKIKPETAGDYVCQVETDGPVAPRGARIRIEDKATGMVLFCKGNPEAIAYWENNDPWRFVNWAEGMVYSVKSAMGAVSTNCNTELLIPDGSKVDIVVYMDDSDADGTEYICPAKPINPVRLEGCKPANERVTVYQNNQRNLIRQNRLKHN